MRAAILIFFLLFFIYSIVDLFLDVKKNFDDKDNKFSHFYKLEDMIKYPKGDKSSYIKIMKKYKVYNVSFSSNDNKSENYHEDYLDNNNINEKDIAFIKKNIKLKVKNFNIKNEKIYLSIYFYNSSPSDTLEEKQVPIQCSFLNKEGIVLDILNFKLPLVIKPKEVILVNDINVSLSNKILDYIKDDNKKNLHIECEYGF